MTATHITRLNQPPIHALSDIPVSELAEHSKRGGFIELDCYQSERGGLIWQGVKWDVESKSDILVTHIERNEVK